MKNKLVLPDRLVAVASLIKKCETLSDVGTDHAFIPIYSVKNGLAKRAIAADIVDGPLKIAAENIKSYGLSDKISVVKSDGLISLPPCEATVIAGMGGLMIGEILQKSKEKAFLSEQLILQPMTCAYELRKTLHENGYKITYERLAKDSGKLYNIMVVKKGIEKYDYDIEYRIGKQVIDRRDELLGEYISHQITVLKRKCDNMQNSLSAEVLHDIDECHRLIAQYQRVGDSIDRR